MEIPRIISEWRTLFEPHRYGGYVNGHTLL